MILILLVWNQQAQGQCPSNVEILNNLKAIEGNTSAQDAEKINQLHQLQQLFLQCHTTKDSVYARIVHRLGGIYSKTGDIEKAINFTKEAVAVNRTGYKETDKSFLANSYFNLGTFYNWLYLSEDSHRSWDSCIFISRQFPHKYNLAFMAFEQKAYAFIKTGDYQKGVETAENGILLAKKVTDTSAEASLLSQKAQAQIELNNIPEAGENIKKALFILVNNNSNIDKLATSYSVYARLLNKKGDKKTAIQYYQKAIELNKTIGYWVQCSRDMLNLGSLYDNYLHDGVNALACYKQALSMVDKANDDYQRAGIYLNMGVVYWRQKDYGQALQFYQKALNALPIHFTDTAIKSNPTVNMLNLVANDYYVSTLLSNKAEALLGQYKIEKKKELLVSAIRTYQLADKAVDLMRWKQYGEQSKLFWRGKTKQMYAHAIEACYLAADNELAFFFMEKSRAVLLNDKLNELGAFTKLPAAEMVKDQELRMQAFTAQQKWASLTTHTSESEVHQAKLLQAKNNFENYIKSLEKKYPAYYQYKYADDVPSLNALQEYLALNKASFIHYFMNDSVTYILSITPKDARLVKLSKKYFNQEQLSRFIELCSEKQTLNNNYGSFALLSNKLYKTLFQPLQLPPGKIIICTDNFLIPFEALCTDSRGKQYLINEYVFSYVYSARNLLKEFTANPAKGNFIGFAPVNFKPYLRVADLKQAAASLQEAAGHYSSTKLFTDKQATKNNFIHNISDYSIVNVFSHARADTDESEPLLFMQDSVIRLSELRLPHKLATRLVVLSACQTNVGKNATGEGIYSLARGFSSASIPSVAATLWKADEQAIYEITTMFHEYLSQGMRKDDALQKAKLNFVKSNSHEKSLPYFWANMVIIGNSEPVEFRENLNIWWWISLSVLGFIVLAGISYHRRNRLIQLK